MKLRLKKICPILKVNKIKDGLLIDNNPMPLMSIHKFEKAHDDFIREMIVEQIIDEEKKTLEMFERVYEALKDKEIIKAYGTIIQRKDNKLIINFLKERKKRKC